MKKILSEDVAYLGAQVMDLLDHVDAIMLFPDMTGDPDCLTSDEMFVFAGIRIRLTEIKADVGRLENA